MARVLPKPGTDLLVIVGPTAVGKTGAAIEIASRIEGEIVSADSMQVYRHMDVGTAKPTQAERARVRFHLVDIADPREQVTVSEWKTRAEAAIADINGRGNRAIVCGGTGLYVRALLDDWKLAETPADPELRAMLRAKCAANGSESLHAELAAIDEATANRLHPHDAVRIERALEVYYATGVPMSEHRKTDRARGARRPARCFGLTLPREELYARVECRVDAMLEAGLEQEVRDLLRDGYGGGLSPMRSLGYKEMVEYISGQLDYSEAVSAMKQNTRRYAKRQQTWFGGDPAIEWIDVSELNSAAVARRVICGLEKEQCVPAPS